MYIYVCLCMYVCVYVCLYVCLFVCMYVCMYIYIYIYILILLLVHTQMPRIAWTPASCYRRQHHRECSPSPVCGSARPWYVAHTRLPLLLLSLLTHAMIPASKGCVVAICIHSLVLIHKYIYINYCPIPIVRLKGQKNSAVPGWILVVCSTSNSYRGDVSFIKSFESRAWRGHRKEKYRG